MIACRSLFRLNLLPWKTTNTYVKPKPLFYFQKYRYCSGLSCEFKMDVRKGRQVNFDPRKRKVVTQTWRTVSTQPNCYQGGGDRGNQQSQLEQVHNGTSSTASISDVEDTNRGVLNEPVGADTSPAIDTIEGTKNDISSDENLISPEKHSVSMEIGCSLMRFVKGKGGITQEEIERETGVKLIFPSSKKEDFIMIEGISAESVAKASEKIQIVVDKAVNSREFDYSHFVSLPLAVHPELVDKLVSFQNTILGIAAVDKEKNLDIDKGGDTSDEEMEDQQSTKASEVLVDPKAEKADDHDKINITSDQDSTKAPQVAVEHKAEDADTSVKVKITNIPLVSYSRKELKTPASETGSSKLMDSGIEKSIFIKPKTFHLTVVMLKLWNKDRVEKAADVLQSVSLKVMDALENRPVSIRLKGLECMRGSLAKARVLYAPIEEIGGEERLLRACQIINDAFIEAGLVIERDTQQKLKLHATLMNARHRKRNKRSRKLDSFDARGIFDLYGSEEWGEYPIREAHLSQRFVFDEDGYYHRCATIPFPDKT